MKRVRDHEHRWGRWRPYGLFGYHARCRRWCCGAELITHSPITGKRP